MKNVRGFTSIEMVVAIVAILGAVGWISNIVKLIGTGFAVASWGGMDVARVVGIFLAPLGAILGFF